MKKLMLLFACLIAAIGSYAHDIIVKKDGSIIEGKVERINSTEVEYKKASNLNGPTYTIQISDILAINYDNGEKETFGTSAAPKSSYFYNPTPVTQESASTFSNDNDLRALNARLKDNPYTKKARNWRIAGWTIGGIFTVGGIICFIMHADRAGSYGEGDFKFQNAGIAFTIVGVGFGTTALILANKYSNKAKAWSRSYSLFDKDIKFKGGSNLNLGLDMITYNEGFTGSNRVNQAIGIGLNYSF